MIRKMLVVLVLLFVMQIETSMAGIEWDSQNKVNVLGGKEELTKFHCYAQSGNVRQDVIEGNFSQLVKEGSYILYRKDSNNMYIVNSKEKTYMEIPLDALMGMAANMMQVEIGDWKVTKLEMEIISKYKCNHIKIDSSYNMKSKLMNMNLRIEQTQEIWGTLDLPVSELSNLFMLQSVKTGWKDLDEQIFNQISISKDVGFPIKSIMKMKQINIAEENDVETSLIEMDSTNVAIKKLDESIFLIPNDFKKIELFSPEMIEKR